MSFANGEGDTIAAIATPPGEGGIGIVRLSGKDAAEVADAFFQAANKRHNNHSVAEFESHKVVYGHIIDDNGCIIDESLCIPMWAPNSYTKEDVVEIQSHGGALIVRRILELALKNGARLAEPGEFTKRAFLNGRLDLSQAQSVMDIIKARTDASLRMAAGHLQGRFSEEIRQMRHDILEIIAHLEASIDFPEDDIEDIAKENACKKITSIKEHIGRILSTFKTGRILRDGLMTAIIGKPNVGKSSLLNALLQEDRAIVTEIPGTTRDSLEEYANIGGVPVRIIDTAGIRDTEDKVEQIGVKKSVSYIKKADLILALFDASSELSPEDEEIIDLLKGREGIVLLTKKDLPAKLDVEQLKKKIGSSFKYISISTTNGEGLKDLENSIVDRVYSGAAGQGEACFVSSVRQAKALKDAEHSLAECLHTINMGMAEDFIVIDVRSAWEKLGEITGDTVNEDIIDQIFSQFCIGK